jgi:hypothetical protein
MKAESAYNVIQVLPEKEKVRLYGMLGVEIKEKKADKKKSKTQSP